MARVCERHSRFAIGVDWDIIAITKCTAYGYSMVGSRFTMCIDGGISILGVRTSVNLPLHSLDHRRACQILGTALLKCIQGSPLDSYPRRELNRLRISICMVYARSNRQANHIHSIAPHWNVSELVRMVLTAHARLIVSHFSFISMTRLSSGAVLKV